MSGGSWLSVVALVMAIGSAVFAWVMARRTRRDRDRMQEMARTTVPGDPENVQVELLDGRRVGVDVVLDRTEYVWRVVNLPVPMEQVSGITVDALPPRTSIEFGPRG